jgi:hypothetical protein
MVTMGIRTGQCQCAGIRFEFAGEPTDASFCHCSICRKLSGSAFAAYIEVSTGALCIADVERRLACYDVTARLTKEFCGTCGTPLFTRHSSFPQFTYVSLGVLDDDRGIVPEYHQFVESKAKWYVINDDLPQYEEWPNL